MIPTDDPRHGSYAGYRAGCECDRCANAQFRYNSRLHADHDRGIYRTVDARGVARRIRALQALGWSMDTIAERAGLSSPQAVYRIATEQSVVWSSTRDVIVRVYEELCTTDASDRLANRKRALAEKNGYAPPEAWVDIDTDDEPWTSCDVVIDEVAIERALKGDRTAVLVRAEREEALRRHLAAGGTESSFGALTGVKASRYRDNKEQAA